MAKDGRYRKGRKIEQLLGLTSISVPRRMLEIGAGSGWISHYFAQQLAGQHDVDAVDVVDNRQSEEGYRFTLVAGTALPFADDTFDVVISNHVIEHVGDDDAQAHHLAEIWRTLRSGGIGYLAVPNRWMVVEPHYKLAFLSWLPTAWRSPYLRWRRRGREYDCCPLTVSQLEALLQRCDFRYEQLHGRALRLTYELERPGSFAYRAIFKRMPDWAFGPFRHLFPTLIYIIKKEG